MRVRDYILLYRPNNLFPVLMEDSTLVLLSLGGFVYPVKKDEVEDFLENYSD